jgi:glutathione S-transferase
LLTISHERAAELRAHLLSAADEFSTGAVAALQQARNAAGEIKKDDTPLDDKTGWYRKEIQTCLDAANDAVNEVLARQARIYLLFGDESPAGIAAAGVASHLRSVMFALEHRPDSIRDHDAMSRYDQNVTRTREQHEKFNRAARAAFTETRWGRFQRWSVKWL